MLPSTVVVGLVLLHVPTWWAFPGRNPVHGVFRTTAPFSWSTKTAMANQPVTRSIASNSLLWSTVNGDDNRNKDGTGMVLAKDTTKSQLFTAFTSLDLTDQYDAVLTGLCAKILDDRTMDEDTTKVALRDPIQLIEEMNTKNIPASPRSLMALIDSTVKTQDAQTMANIMSVCVKNRQGIRQYGALQPDVIPFPINPNSRVQCPDGSVKTRTQRLESLPNPPTDEREKETAYALAFGALVAFCGTTNLLQIDEITPLTNTILFGVSSILVVDNFYDVLKTTTQFLVNQLQKDKKDPKPLELPPKESLPLGLGTGQSTGSLVRGLSRLFTIDAERESRCEAAALFVAYALGLPCFAFRPNAYEGSVLTVESMQPNSAIPPLLSSPGILKMLVWLMAPVAMESMNHPQLIMSDPTEGRGFLQRLEELAASNEAVAQELWWIGNEQERDDLLKWAYTEADLLLRENRKMVSEIAQRLMGGAATIGDCVAVQENWQ